MARLRIPNPPPGVPSIYEIPADGTTLGRERDNRLVLEEPSVSRHHAVLRCQGEGWWIEDPGSSNGTFVNDQRIQRSALHQGDRLRVGEIAMLFEVVAPPPVPGATPASAPLRQRNWRACLVGGGLGVFLLLAGGTWWGWGWLRGRLERLTSTRASSAPLETVPMRPSEAVLPLPRALGDAGDGQPSIKLLSQLPKPLPSGVEALTVCDIGEHGPRRLDRPIVLEFPYDPARLPKDVDPEERLALAHLDESSGRWILAAAQVDPVRHVLRTRTRHLSTWSTVYISLGWRIHRSRRFSVVFSPSETIVYTRVKGRAGQLDARAFAEVLGRDLDLALDQYERAGFRLPEGDSAEDGRVWAFLGQATSYWGSAVIESQWSAFSGNLLFTSNYDTPRQATHDVAHELFHKIQNLDMNVVSMNQRRWWIEASADYAAARVALQQKGTDTTMGGSLKPRYLEKSITYSLSQDDGKQPQSFHDYSTSHFLDYLVSQGADFKAMCDAEMHPSVLDVLDALDPLDKYLRKTFGASRGLDTFYREFARFYLLDPASPMPKLAKGFYEEVPSAKLSLASGARQGSLSATVESSHASQVMAVRAELAQGKTSRKLQVTLAPGTGEGIIASVYKTTPGTKAPLATPKPLGMLGPKPLVAELTANELILVIACNATGSDRKVTVDVKDLSPEAPKTAIPTPTGGVRRLIDVSAFAWVTWNQVAKYEGENWGSRWMEWGTLGGSLQIPEGNTFSVRITQGRYDVTLSGEVTADQVVWLKMKGVSTPALAIKENWELEFRGLPAVQGSPGDYQAMATPKESVVPRDVGRFITRATFERTFPNGVRQVLDKADWDHRSGPWSNLPESPNAQCSFLTVRIARVNARNEPVR